MDQQQPQQPPRISLEEIVVWIDDRKQGVLGVIALIGIAGLVYVVHKSSVEGKEHRATAALFQLQSEHSSLTNEPSASDYRQLLPKTADTGIAQHVELREATSLYSAGNYADAQAKFESFIQAHPGSPLIPEARFAIATCLEAQGKSDEALTKYQELTTRFPQSVLVNRARLGQARLYEKQGDQKQAFRIYQELASRNTSSMSQMGQASPLQIDASIAARRLLKEDPSLMQTNAPSAAPVIAPTQVSPLPKPAGS